MHCILTFCDLLAPALAGLRVAEEDVGGGAVVVVVTRAVEALGRYLYDVRTEGGRGVARHVTNTTDKLRECVTKGGGGPKM